MGRQARARAGFRPDCVVIHGGGNSVGTEIRDADGLARDVRRTVEEVQRLWQGVDVVISEVLPREGNRWVRILKEEVRAGMGVIRQEAKRRGWGFAGHGEFYVGQSVEVEKGLLGDGIHLDDGYGAAVFARSLVGEVQRLKGV
jgi:hypothetical protein